MKPSKRALEHNLRQLLTHSYRQVKPSAEFVTHLEDQLAPWLVEQHQSTRSFHLRPLWGAVLAAAGILALWFVLDRGTAPQEVQPAPGLAGDVTPEQPLIDVPEQDLEAARDLADIEPEGDGGRTQVASTADEPQGDRSTAPGALASTSATIRGSVVVDSSGEALDQFEVSVLRAVPLPQVAVPETVQFSAAGGEFVLTGLQPGDYSFFLQSQGHAVWKRANLTLIAGTTLELDARVIPGGRVRGFVVDRDSGAALAGVMVIAELDVPMQVVSLTEDEFPAEVRAYTRTAADGSFELEHLSAGRQRLRANGPQHAPSWTAEFELEPHKGRDDLLFELGPGGGVRGIVLQADGQPHSMARVVVSRFDPTGGAGNMTYRGLWTDAQGRYSADNLSPGFYVVLLFGDVGPDNDDYGDPEYTSVQIIEGQVVEVDFKSRATGATLRGVVRDSQGEPLAGMNVQLHLGEPGFRAAVTDAKGQYSIELERSGSYLLFAGSVNSVTRIAELRLGAGEERVHNFTLAGASLEAAVRDAQTGAALKGAVLILLPARATTRTELSELDLLIGRAWRGTRGVYSMTNIPPGDYDLLVRTDSGGHASTLIEGLHVAEEGSTLRVEVELPRAGSALIEVVDELGQPVDRARLKLVHPFGRRWRFENSMRTNQSGELLLRGLLPGTWRGSVRTGGYLKAEFELDVDAGLNSTTRVVLVPR